MFENLIKSIVVKEFQYTWTDINQEFIIWVSFLKFSHPETKRIMVDTYAEVVSIEALKSKC